MTSIPTAPNAISWQNIYNVVNRRPTINDPIIPGTNISLGGFGGTLWSDRTSVPFPPQPISILTHFSGKSLAGGADRIPVEPFTTISLNTDTHENNYSVSYNDNGKNPAPFYFTDSGGDRSQYGSNENFYITFYSTYGLRLWVHSGGFNTFDFEEFSYSQYDRLGIQVSKLDEESLENFQSSPNSSTGILYPWLQTSTSKTPPWSQSFGGGRYNSFASLNGYIFPSNTRRAEQLGLREGVSLDLNFKVIRFYFSSDGGSQRNGWYFSVYPLSLDDDGGGGGGGGGGGLDPPKEIR